MSQTQLDITDIEHKVWRWLDEVVIAEKFCPFARTPRLQETIRLRVITEKSVRDVLENIAKECEYLNEHPNCETSLLVLGSALSSFEDYLDALDYANDLLIDLGFEGTYQLASFHPQYLFAGEPSTDISHYTNRAPYPIFHLLREASLSKVLEKVDSPELIPQRNIEHANKLGLAFFKQYL